MAENVPLTKKRANWVKNRNTTLNGSALRYNAAIEERYQRALERLTKQMTNETKRRITALFKSPVAAESPVLDSHALDASISSQARILMNYLTRTFTQIFTSKAGTLAEQMVSATTKVSASNTNESLKRLTGGLSLKTSVVTEGEEEVATALVTENVSLITSIPEEYFKDITGSVMRSITSGRGLADLTPEIQKYEGQTYRRAKNIALDQTRKAYTSISVQKLERNGVKQFKWRHSSAGLHPRESHMMMDGMIFPLDSDELVKQQAALGVPVNDRGLPSVAINCKCFMQPVITFGDGE